MAWMPSAIRQIVPVYKRMIAKNIVCIHTIVGYQWQGTAAQFTTNSKGEIFQHRDTDWQSVANAEGNDDIIAIENEDFGPAYGKWDTNNVHTVPSFTQKQCEALALILVWCYRTHNIPLVLVPDSKAGRRGVAYHRQGIKGNWSGFKYGGWIAGRIWTLYPGKACPGDHRIEQVINVIIPLARVWAGLDKPQAILPPAEEDDMFEASDRVLLQQIHGLVTALNLANAALGASIKQLDRDRPVDFSEITNLMLEYRKATDNLILATRPDSVTWEGWGQFFNWSDLKQNNWAGV